MRQHAGQRAHRTGSSRPSGRRVVPWIALVVLGVAVVGLAALGPPHVVPARRAGEPDQPPPVYGYQVVHTYPHDAGAFSQGLAFADGVLYEGTGLYGRSSLRRVDLESGRVLTHVPLSRRLFGEGIVVLDGEILQLTWRSGVAIVFDKASFKPKATFRYAGEGWGITTDGHRLIMSDGSDTLRLLDPKSFQVVGRLAVRSQGRPVKALNELEYVEGEIYANVWGLDRIARISPKTGRVLGWIDLAGLLKPGERIDPDAVLNGIAYDPHNKRLFVTGKLWPKLFEIRVVPKSGADRR